jgi:DNA invertase Pin-like site-specific DNA recombinase
LLAKKLAEHIETRLNHEFVGSYIDIGPDNRQDFDRMMADCKAGKIDKIQTKSTCCISHDTDELARLLKEFKELGIEVAYLEDVIAELND